MKECRDIPNHVLDEHGVVVGLHGDVSLVRPLEEWIDRRRRRPLGDVDQLFNPNELRGAVTTALATNGYADYTALIVRAVVADALAARTKARDGHVNADQKIDIPSIEFTDEGALVINQRLGFTLRSCLLYKVREEDLDSSGLRVVLLAAKEHGERFATVVAADSAVARLFSLVEVSERLNVARSRSEALAALPGGGPDEAG